MEPLLKYFAYGSNMHPARLRERVPSCNVVGTAMLRGYGLRFHKRSIDGSAKCNALYTGDSSDRVMGVIYQIVAGEKEVLDSFEFLGNGYHQSEVQVTLGDKPECAFAYFAEPQFIDETLRPYIWYKEFVVAGARLHRIPEGYIKEVEFVEAIEDPDPMRAERNLRLLKKTEDRRQKKPT